MLNIIAIFIGGGLGAILRYLSGLMCTNYLKLNCPASTFIVNVVGCFILGFLYIYFIEKSQVPNFIKVALTVGFCGGLTTFSTFSLELFEMINHSQFIQVLTYLSLSVILGIVSVFLGGQLCKMLIN